MDANEVRLSKFLSYVLRHDPASIGLNLDRYGWASIDDLLAHSAAAGRTLTRAELLHVVETNDKKRFTISADGLRIRAAQGHSIEVDLDLPARNPPDVLYHGTAERFVDSILREGLDARARAYVHLSMDEATARRVGARHGRPVVLRVDARGLHDRGQVFYLSENGVWLTERVPPEFLERL